MSFIGKVFHHSKFEFVRTNGKLVIVSEASTLGDGFLDPLFNDSCDIGFFIQGRRDKIAFILDKIDRNAEHEITAWHFTSYTNYKKLNSRAVAGKFKVIVYND